MMCDKCGSDKSHAWKNFYQEGAQLTLCGDCTTVRTDYTPASMKREREKYAKDLVQPFKYDKRADGLRGGLVPNPDFERLYPGGTDRYVRATREMNQAQAKQQEKISDIPNSELL